MLGFALVAECVSLARAVKQTRAEAKEADRDQVEFVRRSPAIDEILRRHRGVEDVASLFTMVLAPDKLLVAAHVDVDDECSGDDVERMTAQLEDELRREVPSVWRVFLDPTPREQAPAEAASR